MRQKRSNKLRSTSHCQSGFNPFDSISKVDPREVCVECKTHSPTNEENCLFCANGHRSCFSCLRDRLTPHLPCLGGCVGFKFCCAGCAVWSCVNKTQLFGFAIGSHSLARERLATERITIAQFHRPLCFCAQKSSESDESVEEFILPRVKKINYEDGREDRHTRLALLKKSLLSHTS